jgi:hypothetical protein
VAEQNENRVSREVLKLSLEVMKQEYEAEYERISTFESQVGPCCVLPQTK